MKQHLFELKFIAWEITKNCNLFCAHCRASATSDSYKNELSTEECLSLIDDILKVGKPTLILTGGEPLMRQDVFQIAKYATSKGLKVVLGSNGTLITEEVATKLSRVPISRIGISLDFPNFTLQDNFRGKTGAFKAAISGIKVAHQVGIEVQINSTITKLNAPFLTDLLKLALDLGVVAFHPFLLVPVGRGQGLKSAELSAEESEQILNWIYNKQKEIGDKIFFKPTCAPHYSRIVRQRAITSSDLIPGGCLAGKSFCFISSEGRVQGCGYLEVEAGNIRRQDFSQIWTNSLLFQELRNPFNLRGKCGVCQFKKVCGGCRARAFAATGDYLQAEPYCIYEPLSATKAK